MPAADLQKAPFQRVENREMKLIKENLFFSLDLLYLAALYKHKKQERNVWVPGTASMYGHPSS